MGQRMDRACDRVVSTKEFFICFIDLQWLLLGTFELRTKCACLNPCWSCKIIVELQSSIIERIVGLVSQNTFLGANLQYTFTAFMETCF